MEARQMADVVRHLIQVGDLTGFAKPADLEDVANQDVKELSPVQLRLLAKVADKAAEAMRSEADEMEHPAGP